MNYAYQIPNLRFSAIAGGVIARYRFLTVNANGEFVHAGAAVKPIGASQTDNKAGEVAECADGIVMVEASVALTAGNLAVTAADGKANKTATVADAIGICLTDAAAGGLVSIKLY